MVLKNSKNLRISKNDEPQEKIQRKIFKTWPEVLAYLNIETVELPWNANGEMALAILRARYIQKFSALEDEFLDDVVEAYSDRSTPDQLAALGEAMQELKLRFCQLNIPLKSEAGYTVFAVAADDTSDYLSRWKEVLTRRQFFRSINTFALRHGETLDNPADDVQIPMHSVQIIGASENRITPYILDKYFLIVPFETYDQNHPEPLINVRVYDIRTWPLRELQDISLSFDRNNIEPYTLSIRNDGTETVYVGDDPQRARTWKKTALNADGVLIPIYEDEDEDEDDQWKGLALGASAPPAIPDIEDATPWFTLDGKVVYYYDNDDLANRQEEDENASPSVSIRKRREQRRLRNTLLEYNSADQKYRIMSLPGAAYIDKDDLVLYRNQWIIIPDSIFSRDASYILRLWNPFTGECLRLTKNDMGCHDIDQIIPTGNGDILMLLDDGRLCHFDVDLVTWLKSDLLQHGVKLDAWQPEINRGYENFPDTANVRFRRLRRDIADRLLVTFADGKTLDIQLNDTKRPIRRMQL